MSAYQISLFRSAISTIILWWACQGRREVARSWLPGGKEGHSEREDDISAVSRYCMLSGMGILTRAVATDDVGRLAILALKSEPGPASES